MQDISHLTRMQRQLYLSYDNVAVHHGKPKLIALRVVGVALALCAALMITGL